MLGVGDVEGVTDLVGEFEGVAEGVTDIESATDIEGEGVLELLGMADLEGDVDVEGVGDLEGLGAADLEGVVDMVGVAEGAFGLVGVGDGDSPTASLSTPSHQLIKVVCHTVVHNEKRNKKLHWSVCETPIRDEASNLLP